MDAATEQWRHECEVRFVLKIRAADREAAGEYLDGVKNKRGEAAANRLRADCAEQWARGNRGRSGEWFDNGSEHARSRD